MYIYNVCVKSTESNTIEKIVKSNLCVKSTESNTIEKIVKKQNVLKNHSLQSDKVGPGQWFATCV